LTQFQIGTSRDASKHGRKAGVPVFMQKGSTLKVMEELNTQGKQTSFYKYCPGNFGYTIVYSPSLFHSTALAAHFLDLNPLPYSDPYEVRKQCSLQNSGNNKGRK